MSTFSGILPEPNPLVRPEGVAHESVQFQAMLKKTLAVVKKIDKEMVKTKIEGLITRDQTGKLAEIIAVTGFLKEDDLTPLIGSNIIDVRKSICDTILSYYLRKVGRKDVPGRDYWAAVSALPEDPNLRAKSIDEVSSEYIAAHEQNLLTFDEPQEPIADDNRQVELPDFQPQGILQHVAAPVMGISLSLGLSVTQAIDLNDARLGRGRAFDLHQAKILQSAFAYQGFDPIKMTSLLHERYKNWVIPYDIRLDSEDGGSIHMTQESPFIHDMSLLCLIFLNRGADWTKITQKSKERRELLNRILEFIPSKSVDWLLNFHQLLRPHTGKKSLLLKNILPWAKKVFFTSRCMASN